MMKYVNKLRDCEFFDLMIAIKKMSYGDIKRCEHFNKDDYYLVHIWDNSPDFKDREADQYFKFNDFTISENSVEFNFFLFMLNHFGNEWYDEAKIYYETDKDKLEILEQAKRAYEREIEIDIEIDNEIMQDINNGL